MNPTAQTEPALQMAGVSVPSMRDQARTVVSDINWTVAQGGFWIVAGLQGSGKSDLMMLAASLMGPTSGEYNVLGEKMPIFDEQRIVARKRVGLVFDSGQPFNHLTVRENVALPVRYHLSLSHEKADRRIEPLLQALGLAGLADVTPGALTRNWTRRMGLARALVLEPELLLLDNPLGGLDPVHTRWWLNMLTDLSRGSQITGGKRLTIVATTSDLRPWRAVATHFALLREGTFHILGGWKEVEAASAELAREVLAVERSEIGFQ
jgi:ABC-type transporter Mla maintaining outer membrane lipid asymmetry ATPase subunit MlaF